MREIKEKEASTAEQRRTQLGLYRTGENAFHCEKSKRIIFRRCGSSTMKAPSTNHR